MNPLKTFQLSIRHLSLSLITLLLLSGDLSAQGGAEDSAPWTLQQALELLNDSPWARQETVTRVIEGVGSGVFGEKEIFSRYYVRLLSARPVRRAYARIEAILKGSEDLTDIQKNKLEAINRAKIDLDMYRYVVIAVSFRSNHPSFEQEVKNILKTHTVETLKTRAYLSTSSFPQVELLAFYPLVEDAVGAKFVFPREVGGVSIFSREDTSFVFEMDLPGDAPQLRTTFPVSVEVLTDLDSGKTSQADLIRIQDFQVQVSELTRTVDLHSQRLGELVNFFPAQKGGTFHGSIYEFHRNDNLDARNFFDPVGRPLPEFKRNQFGASAGVALGPRLNIFGSYDALRIIQGSTILSHVPTPEMKSGDFSEFLSGDFQLPLRDPETGTMFPGNRIPDERIHPVARRLVSLLQDPNRNDRSRNFVNNQPLVDDQDEVSLRVDFQLDEQNAVSGRYQLVEREELRPHPLPGFGSRRNETENEVSVFFTRTFSSNLVGRWEFEFDREVDSWTSRAGRKAGLLQSLGIQGVKVPDAQSEGFPVFELVGYRSFGDENLPESEVGNRFDLDTDLTYVRGNHTIQFESEIRFRQINNDSSPSLQRGSFTFTGQFTGDAFADFLLGRADAATRAIGSSRQDLRRKGFELHISDEWKIHPQLTFSSGLTYQYSAPYRSIHDNVSTFHPLLFEPPRNGEIVVLGSQQAQGLGLEDTGEGGAVFPDWNDWAPRIGLAYRPFGDRRMVVRSFYGIFYDSPESWIFRDFMARNFPFYYIQGSEAAVDSFGLDLSSPFQTDTPTELTIRGISPEVSTSYDQSWGLAMQNDLSEQWQIEIAYRGRKGTHEYRVLPANVPLPGPGEIQARRPNPAFGEFWIVSDGGVRARHELELNGERRLADGYSLKFEFEWARRFDDDFRGQPSNPRNLRAEWAPSRGFSERCFSLNYIIDLPFGTGYSLERNGNWLKWLMTGWRVSGTTEIESGELSSALLPGDPNNDGLHADRPDRLGPANLEPSIRSIDQWFNTEDFGYPAAFEFGNAGRNILVGPAFHKWDISLVKEALFANDHRLQVRFAFFNAFNHPNFDQPNRVFGTRLFGQISGAGRAREIEIALKYSF